MESDQMITRKVRAERKSLLELVEQAAKKRAQRESIGFNSSI